MKYELWLITRYTGGSVIKLPSKWASIVHVAVFCGGPNWEATMSKGNDSFFLTAALIVAFLAACAGFGGAFG
ncbi:MAG: hypothetical protein WDN06_01975 [Asticcacaulis sp.]